MVYRCTRCESGLVYDKKADLLYCKFCGSFYSAEACTEEDLKEMSENVPTQSVDHFSTGRPVFDSMSMDFPDLDELLDSRSDSWKEQKTRKVEETPVNLFTEPQKKFSSTPAPSLASIESAFASASQLSNRDNQSSIARKKEFSSMNFEDDFEDEYNNKKKDTVNIFSQNSYENSSNSNTFTKSLEKPPVYNDPVTQQAPAYTAPVTEQAPAYTAPVTEQAPVYNTPVTEQTPVYTAPVTEQVPAYEEPKKEYSVPDFSVPQFQVNVPPVNTKEPQFEEQAAEEKGSPAVNIYDRRMPTMSAEPAEPEPTDINMRVYFCTSCSAKVMVSEGDVSPFCSFCGNTSIIFDRDLKLDRPKRILPFRLTKEHAMNVIKDRLGYGRFALDEIDELEVENVRAIYIPYWVYHTEIERSMNITVMEEELMEGPMAKKGQTLTKEVNYSKHASNGYHVYLDACKNLNDVMAERLEPFHMDKMVRFSTSYLKGAYVDKYDVVAAERMEDARLSSQMLLDHEILSGISGVKRDPKDPDRILNVEKKDIQENYHVKDTEYVLLPAYFVAIQYQNHSYNVIVNGQTGKVVSNLPLNQEKVKVEVIKNSVLTGLLFATLFMLFTSVSIGRSSLAFLLLLPIAALAYFIYLGIDSKKKFDESYYRMQLSKLQKYAEEGRK